MTHKKFLNFDNARTKEQTELMRKIEKDGVCPFCQEHFKKYHPKPIIKETDWSFFTENMSPYEGTKYHFIFVYKPAHVTSPVDIELPASKDLFALMQWAVKEYKIPGGSFFMRFGDTKYNGSSVEHLHSHLIVGDIENPNHQPVRVKLG